MDGTVCVGGITKKRRGALWYPVERCLVVRIRLYGNYSFRVFFSGGGGQLGGNDWHDTTLSEQALRPSILIGNGAFLLCSKMRRLGCEGILRYDE